MKAFVQFMASPAGRFLRVIAGSALIVWGLFFTGGFNGKLIAGIGLLPILTGAFNICVIAPFLGSLINGSKVKASNN
jgi:hypothetical protein